MPEHSHNSFDERLAEAALAALPPVREDEPASLHQDILDELHDHLACAFRSELLRTNGDTARAERNVRDRFGDPARIARRLWCDAMKGQLMTQKVLIGTCVVLVIASLGFYGFMWRAFDASQERNAQLAAQTQAVSAELLAEAQRTNAALLARVEELAKSNAIADPEWNQVTLRLKPSVPAPIAHTIETIRVAEKEQGGEFWEFEADAKGVVDCGLMQPGKYTVYLETTWGEGCYRQITVLPGRPLEVTITCPAAIPRTVPFEVKIDWPANLDSYARRDSTWLLVSMGGQLVREFGEDKWTMHDGGRLLAFHPDGRMLNLSTLEVKNLDPLTISRASTVREFIIERRGARPVVQANEVWIGAKYTVGSMAYAERDESQNPLTMLHDISKPAIDLGWDAPHGMTGGTLANLLTVALPKPTLTVEKQPIARWTIPMPAGLVEWAKLRIAEKARDPNRSFYGLQEHELYPLFRSDIAPGGAIAPVEAARPEGR